MKSKIDNLINRQINLILEYGNRELLPAEYLSFIIENYEHLVCLNSEDDTTDRKVVDSLSILVSRLK